MAKGWNIDPAAFAGLVAEDVKLRQRTIAIQLLNEIVQRSPVGNPELWAINATAVQYNKAVGEWNESLYAVPANLTKTGRLRKKVRVNDSMDIRRPAEYRAGTFRASHFVSIGEPDHSVPTEPDPRGTMTFLNGKNIIDQAPAYSVIYIQSNLPYSVPLENGHSTQAPTGVYAVSFNGVIQAYKWPLQKSETLSFPEWRHRPLLPLMRWIIPMVRYLTPATAISGPASPTLQDRLAQPRSGMGQSSTGRAYSSFSYLFRLAPGRCLSPGRLIS